MTYVIDTHILLWLIFSPEKVAAKKEGISKGELIRNVMDAALNHPPKNSLNDDPLFSDNAFFTGDVPNDISKNHDRYLYDKSNDFS